MLMYRVELRLANLDISPYSKHQMKLLKHKYVIALILFAASFLILASPQRTLALNGCPTAAGNDTQVSAQQDCLDKYRAQCVKDNYKAGFCADLTVAQVNQCKTGTGTGLKAACMKTLEKAWTPTAQPTNVSAGCSSLDPTCTPTGGDCKGNGTIESVNEKNCGIISYIVIITNVLSALVGVIIVAMIIWGGIQYSTAGADASKVQAAKQKIINALVALVLFVFGFTIVQWLIPGGLF